MKVYVGSKARHWQFWGALRAAGVPIVASWIDAPFNHTGEEPSEDAWSLHWQKCVREAAECDILLLYGGPDERQLGSLIEAGAALAHNKRVFVVAPTAHFSFANHPRCRVFNTLGEAVEAIKAAAAISRDEEERAATMGWDAAAQARVAAPLNQLRRTRALRVARQAIGKAVGVKISARTTATSMRFAQAGVGPDGGRASQKPRFFNENNDATRLGTSGRTAGPTRGWMGAHAPITTVFVPET